MKKFSWKNFVSKKKIAGAGMLAALTPTIASAQAPSSYVNKISDGLFQEILNVAPKIALVVVAWGVVMYLIAADEHKKSKYRGTAFIAILCYLILLVLQPLMGWFGGLI